MDYLSHGMLRLGRGHVSYKNPTFFQPLIGDVTVHLGMEDRSTTKPAAATGARRPIRARDSAWAAACAGWLAGHGATPNSISLMSVGCAAISGSALVAARIVEAPIGRCALFLVAIVGIQSRLLCNLFDGMVAVEGKKSSRSGEVFNDFPDRVADPIIFAAAGYAIGGPWAVALGWAAALLAVMTAYVRVLGRSLGTQTYFTGPMAKQHRMAVMTAACAIAAILVFRRWERFAMVPALAIVCVGCVLTMIRRTRQIVHELELR
jgi:phosphatidylglycerophosphate synthase